jgi:hypothetical protein
VSACTLEWSEHDSALEKQRARSRPDAVLAVTLSLNEFDILQKEAQDEPKDKIGEEGGE